MRRARAAMVVGLWAVAAALFQGPAAAGVMQQPERDIVASDAAAANSGVTLILTGAADQSTMCLVLTWDRSTDPALHVTGTPSVPASATGSTLQSVVQGLVASLLSLFGVVSDMAST